MKRMIIIAIFLTVALALAAQEEKKLTILHTNDFHSHLQGYAPESAYTPGVADNDPTIGGMARIAGIIEAVRNENPGSALVVDAGDCLMGTLFQALEPETGFQHALMKKAGYDVVAMGNHDFDFGPEAFAGILRKASQRGEIPLILTGNAITDPDDPADDAFEALISDGLIKPYTVKEINGIRIGLFSLIGKDADESAPYAPPVTFGKIIPAAKKLVRNLKKEGCDVIICLSHSGIRKDDKGEWTGEDVKLASKVKGIDLIISGHTHTLLKEPLVVNAVPIVAVGDNGRFVGRIDARVINGSLKLEKYEAIPVDDRTTALEEIQSEIVLQQQKINEAILNPIGMTYTMPVAIAPYTVSYDEYGKAADSNLGVLVADAIYNYVNQEGPGTDIAIVAAGVLRDPIQPGVQSVADIFRVMSLGSGNDNVPGYSLSKMWVTGKELRNITEILLFTSATASSNYPYYSHLRIEYDPEGGLFNKVRKIEITDRLGNVKEVNTDKDDPKLYSIVANSYMADNLGLVKKKTFGLIKVEPKDSNGNIVTEMDDFVMDFNDAQPGIQEGKEWIALLKYLQRFKPAEEGGLPVIPDSYRNPVKSLVPVNRPK
ncbi:MAG TPA: bifunctional UDP-sugar hydrolase/5'-nucleotidase [Bacteroidales bacterium]|nr:bifunctional UDP-sugar hydrolase/5'-nucleotidase [Bacteroidales bacterium]HPS98125.1 bifunctional UDP-sugar hydrolase/5'-nucleotidase [Bacteroidales bacterium]